MAVDTKSTIKSEIDEKSLVLIRQIPSTANEPGLIKICVNSSGQSLSCDVNTLDFLNAVKSVFPELSINI